MNIRQIALASLLATVAVAIGGCASSNAGNPQPEPSSTTNPVSSSSGSVSATAGSGPLATIDPCKLITVEEGQRFGITKAKNVVVTERARNCEYSGQGFLVGIAVWRDQGLADFRDVDGPLTKTTVQGRPALLQRVNKGGCVYAIGLTPSTRVDIDTEFGTGAEERQQACELAPKIADVVAPKLQP